MPKLTARKEMTPNELKEANKAYAKTYYQKNKGTDKFKVYPKKQGSSRAADVKVTDNAIKRLLRDDNNIIKLIETVGVDKIQKMVEYLSMFDTTDGSFE
mgnify:CR=1 FL=1